MFNVSKSVVFLTGDRGFESVSLQQRVPMSRGNSPPRVTNVRISPTHRLVLDFAREFLPVDYDEVRHIFSRRGAYRRYKDLLVRRGALERWYDFSNKAEEAVLRSGARRTGSIS